MLYVTTRNDRDAFTVQHILSEDRGADGGLYLPFRFPVFSDADLKKLQVLSFNQRVAAILNLFFGKKLNSWDVDFSVGRYPVRLKQLPNRIIMGEFWHNPQWKYGYLNERLTALLVEQDLVPGNWVNIAVRMAVLAGALLNSKDNESGKTDIAVTVGDFSVPISAWYLRKMGFPIGNIVCCCNESNQIWDLICLGQMKTEEPVPQNLERLIYGCGGRREAERFSGCCTKGDIYAVSEGMLQELRKGFYVSVVSENRLETAIPNVFKTHNYILQPDTASAYCGLMDYRAKTGVFRNVMVICDDSPVCTVEKVAECMNMSQEDIMKLI